MDFGHWIKELNAKHENKPIIDTLDEFWGSKGP